MKVVRRALGTALLLFSVGCGSRTSSPAVRPGPPPVPLHLEPACDLVPAAGVGWVVAIAPRAIASVPDLIPAIGTVLTEPRLQAFATSHGGIDLRQVEELCIARYPDALLTVARVPLDPERVAAAFDDRSGRPAVRALLVPNPRVLRLTGDMNSGPQQLLLFGRHAAALEEGKTGAIRAVEAFALGKLKKARPVLKTEVLARLAGLLGDAPVRLLAPGPFEGDSANGLGGLLRAATAVGGSARWSGSGAGVSVRLVLTGAWGDDAHAAGERLAAVVHVLAESPAGRLFGLGHPTREPRVRTEPDALIVDAVLDGEALARGVHDAVDAEVSEIMRR